MGEYLINHKWIEFFLRTPYQKHHTSKVKTPIPVKAYKGKSPYIFISYAHEDSEKVYPQIKWIHKKGFKISPYRTLINADPSVNEYYNHLVSRWDSRRETKYGFKGK